MILDSGICTVFRKTDTSEPGSMPVTNYIPIWASWYGELSYETAPVWEGEGRKEQKVDSRIRILQNRAISQDDVVVLEHLENFKDRTPGIVTYKIIRAYHGQDDDGPTQISDLTLEVVTP